MPITIAGQEVTNPTVNVGTSNEIVNTVTVVESDGTSTVVYSRVVAREFTTTDAMISFAISEAGVATFSILEGTFVASTLRVSGFTGQVISGDNVGTVIADTTRTLRGDFTVPNNPALWTNAGQDVEFSVNTLQDAVDQEAAWIRTNEGEITGGTAQPEMCGMFGDWEGGGVTNIRDASGQLVSVTGNTPASADCGETMEMCEIFRTRTCTTTFTNAMRTDTYTCSVTTQGEGTGTCSAVSSLGLPTGNLGDTDTFEVTGLMRTTSRIDTSPTRMVTNNSYIPALGEFSAADLMITASNTPIPFLGLNVGANALTYIDFGAHADSVTAATVSAAISQNGLTSDRTVTLTFSVTGTIPTGFQDPGSEYVFSMETVQKIQLAQQLVDATAASVSPTQANIVPGNAASGTAQVTAVSPTNGRWHATTGATALVTLTSATGSGNGSFNWAYNGNNVNRDIAIEVRSGHTIGGGNLLATFELTI